MANRMRVNEKRECGSRRSRLPTNAMLTLSPRSARGRTDVFPSRVTARPRHRRSSQEINRDCRRGPRLDSRPDRLQAPERGTHTRSPRQSPCPRGAPERATNPAGQASTLGNKPPGWRAPPRRQRNRLIPRRHRRGLFLPYLHYLVLAPGFGSLASFPRCNLARQTELVSTEPGSPGLAGRCRPTRLPESAQHRSASVPQPHSISAPQP